MNLTVKLDEVKYKKEYWNEFYKGNNVVIKESDFASFVISYLKEGSKILDIGCGNGRDSIFFCRNNMSVYAIDQSSRAIEDLRKKELKNLELINGDFVEILGHFNNYFDYLYSRFTIHSINRQEENRLILNACNAIKDEGLFFIEVRSINDELYGQGEKVGENEYIYNSHYRRFIVKEELEELLKQSGFDIAYSLEDKNLAPYNDLNPYVIRIIAKKI